MVRTAQPSGSRTHSVLGALVDLVAPVRNRLMRLLLWRVKGSGNRIECSRARLVRARLTVIGDNNTVMLAPGSRLRSCRIVIKGSSNTITIAPSILSGTTISVLGSANVISIGDTCWLTDLTLTCEDADNTIEIGRSSHVFGPVTMAAIEGTRIKVGEDCLFSQGVDLRTGDSHSLVDLAGNRLNPSVDISLGRHVWVGLNALLLKGTAISDSSVVGAGSLVTNKFDQPHCCIAGNPAKIVRSGVDWRHERIATTAHNRAIPC